VDNEAIDFFLKVAEARSLSQASRLHRLPKSTLSYKIRQLEDKLGVALFVREGRDMLLTDAGSEFLDHARRIQQAYSGAQEAVSSLRQEIGGTLTIGSTNEFGTSFTSELLCAFRQAYPQLRLDVVVLTDTYLFSPERSYVFDGIFAWGEPSQLDYVARRLTGASFRLFASPDYLAERGRPGNPEMLHGHRGIMLRKPTGVLPWHLIQGDDSFELMPDATCITNDYWMAKYFAIAGQGIVLLPDFFTDIECASGHLVPVLPEWRTPEVPVNLLYPRRRYASRKFAAFQEFCVDYYRKQAEHHLPRYYAVVETPGRAALPPDAEARQR
jgi:DNA-binding transcriptional LysR family regulator